MAKAKADIRSIARSHAATAMKVLVEIMSDPSAPFSARVDAATQVLNRGCGALVPDHVRFIPDNREFYVYSIQKDGELIYIGKGIGRRSFNSAKRFAGRPRIRAVFNSEKQALAFESRLIKRFQPRENVMLKGPENRGLTGNG
jgi:hypothetical protein